MNGPHPKVEKPLNAGLVTYDGLVDKLTATLQLIKYLSLHSQNCLSQIRD